MAPVKKRPRLDAKVPSQKEELLMLHENAVNQFLEDLDAIVNDDKDAVDKASCSLLSIRSLQRSLLQRMQQSQEAVQAKRQELESRKLQLQNLLYEQMYLEKQCQSLQEFATPQLEKMCRDEADDKDEEASSSLFVMNEFLCGSGNTSHMDPMQQEVVMAKLHKELNLRGSLERDYKSAKDQLDQKKRAVQHKQQFVQDLPHKLQAVETASLPLQKFFVERASKESTDSSSTVHLLGTERQELFDKALAQLPAPLYTLFVQLQSYLDAHVEKDLGLEIGTNEKRSKTKDLFETHKHGVLLRLPVPDMGASAARSKKRRVTVHFDFIPQLHMVTARAYGCDAVDVSTLLVNLFPGDDGSVALNGSNLAKKEEDEALTMQDLEKGLEEKRPYHWCNYIAGLRFPLVQKQEQPLQHNTKAVMDALLRRLSANTTLQYLLQTLEKRKSIPVHPSVTCFNNNDKTCLTKLVGWTQEATSDDKHHKSFLAMIRRKSSTLRATVTLDATRYPSVPPMWSLLSCETSWGKQHGSATALQDLSTNPLYDESLGTLQRKINREIDGLVVESQEETYEWILAHQLRKLVEEWDKLQKEKEKGKYN